MSIEGVALTRLRVKLRDQNAIDEKSIAAAGAGPIMHVSSDTVHVVIGDEAPALAAAMQEAG